MQTKVKALIDITADMLALEDCGFPADIVVFRKGELIERDGVANSARYIAVKVESWGWADVHEFFVQRSPVWETEA